MGEEKRMTQANQTGLLLGQMMDRPLSISTVMDFASDVHAGRRIVSRTVEGPLHDYSFAEAWWRIAKAAHALAALGVRPGDRVATLAWNGYRHFELYYAIAGIGAVCHTINPRLFPEQIAWIVNHAEDSVLCFDLTFAPLVASLAPHLPKGLKLVFLSDEAHRPETHPDALAYETLLASQPTRYDWPELPEKAASALCYTSGTTGDPKGALYSHRSTLMHAFATALGVPQSFGVGKRVLPVVPLFHVNAWGLPYAAPLTGTDLVFPGPKLDGPSLFSLMEEAGVTSAWGVPTVWAGLIAEMQKQGRKPAGLELLLIGGSAVPPAMIRQLDVLGVDTIHGWGMTEMSPIGTVSRPTRSADPEERVAAAIPQGQRLFGVEMKIVDDDGNRLPNDDTARGELLVRGPAIISGYFNAPAASATAFDNDGWFRTGDVARISAAGVLTIVDRTKDLIKSGGEWISSIDLENAAIAVPGVAMAAAIAVPHPKWDERPLLAVIRAEGSAVTEAAILTAMAGRLAKWQLPDAVVFVDRIPMTATGKISKKDLREELRDHFKDH